MMWGGFELSHTTPLHRVQENVAGTGYRDDVLQPLVLPALQAVGQGAVLGQGDVLQAVGHGDVPGQGAVLQAVGQGAVLGQGDVLVRALSWVRAMSRVRALSCMTKTPVLIQHVS